MNKFTNSLATSSAVNSEILQGSVSNLEKAVISILNNNLIEGKKLIESSKFLYSARDFEYDPVVIYESMLNGVVPFIQKRYLY